MSGWQEWFKVKAALDDPEWDFRTIGGIAKETGLDPRQVEQLLAQHRREIRQTLLRDGRVILYAEDPAEDSSRDLRRDAAVCETVMVGLVLCGIGGGFAVEVRAV